MAQKRKPKDLVLVQGPAIDGNGVTVLRAREERLELGTMRPLEQGRPIHGEVVKLTPRPELPYLFDAETQLTVAASTAEGADKSEPSESRGTSAGPAQVASATYRKNWDAIYRKSAKGMAN